MNPAVEAILAAYEERAAQEAQRISAGEQIPLDDQLLTVGPVVGGLLNGLAKGIGAKTILELGTSYGGSTVWLAEAAQATGGRVISIDIAADKQAYSRDMLRKAGLEASVQFLTGDAVEEIRKWDGAFDFILVDLWKDLYVPCLEAFYPKLAPGALIVADNCTYPPDAIVTVGKYRAAVRAMPYIESILLPVGNGIELSRFTKNL